MDTSVVSRSPWPGIVGHEHAVALLSRAVTEGRPSHAYLLTGSPAIGKETVARAFAQALLCLAPGGGICGECRACQLVAHGNHPDFLVLDLEAQRRLLDEREVAAAYKVETIRRLQSDLSRRPVEARWKVVLLLEVERMTTAAANAFLKTLEEPPPYVVLLLTARDKGVLLPTIISRCQVLLLRPAPVGQIETFLRTLPGASAEQAALVARLSGGRVGWAVRALGANQKSKQSDPGVLDERRAALEALTTALRSTRTDRLALAQTLAKQEDLSLLETWASWWRDALLIKHGTPEAVTNIDARPSLEQVVAQLPEPEIRRALHALQRTLGLLEETNVNAQLAWEVLLLQLPVSLDGPATRWSRGATTL